MKKNILIVNVNWIGDALFSTPFIRAVREAYPDSRIACLLHPRCREVLEGNARIDEIIIYDEEGRHKGLFGKLKLISGLRNRKFDTALILHRSFTKALITLLAGIKERVGYDLKHRGFLLTKAVEVPGEDIHKVEYFLNIAKAIGVEPHDRSYEFFIDKRDRDVAQELLFRHGVKDPDPLVTLCPGGNWDPKRWPKENFALLADEIAERFNAKIVITGAKRDEKLGEYVAGLMKRKPINLSGKTSLKELGAIFERSSLVVANDTGSMHLAVAVKANVIALFGPTSELLTGPYGNGHYIVISKDRDCEVPCYDVSCKDNRCMKEIKVEDVINEAVKFLNANEKTQNAKRIL
jgi:heptosyltransferase-2